MGYSRPQVWWGGVSCLCLLHSFPGWVPPYVGTRSAARLGAPLRGNQVCCRLLLVPSHRAVAVLAASEGSVCIEQGHVFRTTTDAFSSRGDSANGTSFLG